MLPEKAEEASSLDGFQFDRAALMKGTTMRRISLAGLLLAIAASGAAAGETGVINQAGPYEATMQFYLHPAHGFPGTPPDAAQPAAVSSSNSASAKPKDTDNRVASSTRAYDQDKRRGVDTRGKSK
jgi:hypothetical protein